MFGEIAHCTRNENDARFAQLNIDFLAAARIRPVAAIAIPVHIVRCTFMEHHLHYCGRCDP
ncbi:MAG: hypothetical protein O7G83_21605, partial [Proteobacteria bacterium]|nr:hypothetical protein [Pseudomonadota bacterium]